MNKGLKVFFIVIIIIAFGVLGFCGYKLFTAWSGYKQANDTYKEVEDLFYEEGEETDSQGNVKKQLSWHWDYNKMLELCPDTVGYISLPKVLSYPVLQAEDNDKYLRHMYDGTYNIAGSIFVDAACVGGLENRYAVVYGHNMDDGSMFGNITKYKDEEYYKEHPVFDVYVKDQHYKYYVFSAFQASASGYVFRYNLPDDIFAEQVAMLRSECPYETNAPEITKDSHVIVLSTCIDYPRDYNYRYVVCLVRGEKVED